jgi:hypothetical protein
LIQNKVLLVVDHTIKELCLFGVNINFKKKNMKNIISKNIHRYGFVYDGGM